MTTQTLNPKVDAYLDKVQPFARPIMEHLRQLVHQRLPRRRRNDQVEPAVF